MTRFIPRNRYNHPVDIPPLQWTPTGYRRITPRGIGAPVPLPLTRVKTRPRERALWLSRLGWGTLQLLAFALIACAAALLTMALANIF